MALSEPQVSNHQWIHRYWQSSDDLPKDDPYHCYEGLRLIIDKTLAKRKHEEFESQIQREVARPTPGIFALPAFTKGVCSSWFHHGTCSRGTKCSYSHNESERGAGRAGGKGGSKGRKGSPQSPGSFGDAKT